MFMLENNIMNHSQYELNYMNFYKDFFLPIKMNIQFIYNLYENCYIFYSFMLENNIMNHSQCVCI
jgi:hypothetical protein